MNDSFVAASVHGSIQSAIHIGIGRRRFFTFSRWFADRFVAYGDDVSRLSGIN